MIMMKSKNSMKTQSLTMEVRQTTIWIIPLSLNLKMDNESQDIKFNRGLDLFIESVMKPDHKLRQCAHNQKCFNELMWVRDDVLEYLKSQRRDA